MTTTNQKATVRQSTQLIKKYLKQKYGITASVTSSFYSGGSSLYVSYVLGPDIKTVEAELKRLQTANYGMEDDSPGYKKMAERGMVLDGKHLEDYSCVFVSQELPDEFRLRIAQFLRKQLCLTELPEVNHIPDLATYFKTSFNEHCVMWHDVVRNLVRAKNFVTQDYTQINLLDVGIIDGTMDYKIIYEHRGMIYDTATPVTYTPTIKKMSRLELNQIRVIDYSNTQIALTGDITEIKPQLIAISGAIEVKAAGNQALMTFPKTRMSEISDILIEYSQIN